MNAVEMFAGAGGMAIGLHQAGWRAQALIEFDAAAFATLAANVRAIGGPTDLLLNDVREVDFSSYAGADLLAAGAPCQPWSRAGKRGHHRDERNLFHEVFRAQREILPRAVVIENVAGLHTAEQGKYLEYLELCLAFPFAEPVVRRQAWHTALAALRQLVGGTPQRAIRTYRVSHAVLQAADYGVPQCRSRLFIVALRSDLESDWSPPTPTHSRRLLVAHQKGLSLPSADKGSPGSARWQTVRDAIGDLPRPTSTAVSARVPWHFIRDGAREYPGHTGSAMDWPAKTLKAGVHGVAGGENMMRTRDGGVRYFTVREAARLQTFPDSVQFMGSWGDAFRQIGNAVPVRLAEAVGRSIAAAFNHTDKA